MRSRDGNKSFSLSICSVVVFFLSSIFLQADEYLVSYRYVVKDATLYNETLNISKSMKKCEGEEADSIYLQSNNQHNLKDIISKKSTKFIDFIHKLGMDVDHKEITENFQNRSTTIMTLKTTCFKVDINQNFAKISALN